MISGDFYGGIAADLAGNVFVVDRINESVLKIPAGGGTPVTLASGLSGAYSIAVDGADNVYVTELKGIKNTCKRRNRFYINSQSISPSSQGLAIDAAGDVFTSTTTGIWEIPANGGPMIFAAKLNALFMAVDSKEQANITHLRIIIS